MRPNSIYAARTNNVLQIAFGQCLYDGRLAFLGKLRKARFKPLVNVSADARRGTVSDDVTAIVWHHENIREMAYGGSSTLQSSRTLVVGQIKKLPSCRFKCSLLSLRTGVDIDNWVSSQTDGKLQCDAWKDYLNSRLPPSAWLLLRRLASSRTFWSVPLINGFRSFRTHALSRFLNYCFTSPRIIVHTGVL